jgi:uncharacterized protein (DUF2126 family)
MLNILSAKYGYSAENDSANNVNVTVENRPVMVMVDHGTDAEWEAKAVEQQRRLVSGEAHEPNLNAPR